MNPRLLVDCIAYLKNEIGMPYVFLTSNASMSFPEAVEECMKAGLDSLKWSVNAADESQFERIMGVADGSSATRWTTSAPPGSAPARGYQTRLYASSILYDGEQRERMARLLAISVQPYVDQHYWLPLYSDGRVRHTARGGARLPAHRRKPGADRRPARAASLLVGLHRGARDGGGKSVGVLLRRDGELDDGRSHPAVLHGGLEFRAFVRLREAHLRKDVSNTPCQQCVAYGMTRAWAR
jgi:hypothetical protein